MGLFSFLVKIFGGGATIGPDYYNKLLRLDPNETITFGTGGRYLQGDGNTAGVGKPGRRTGGTVSLGGNYMLALTDRNRMAIGDMASTDPATALHFEHGSLSIEDHGYLGQKGGALSGHTDYKLPGPTGVMERVKILQFNPRHGQPFRVIAADSVVAQILSWAQPS